MKIAVMGAGAVGCYYGGMLARGGHEVTLIGRPMHVEAVRRDGLRVQTATFDERVSVASTADASGVADAEVVLLCVKSTDTAAAGLAMRPHLRQDAVVVCLQNGVDNAERLREVLMQEVAACVVYVATGMAGPGHVRHHGRGELVIEPSSRSRALQDVFSGCGIPVEISDNVRGALWSKLILNCAYNALSAITQLTYGQLVALPGVDEVMAGATRECLALAQVEGVIIDGDALQSVRQLAATMPGQHSSTAQDLARGHLSEIDHLNGYIVRKSADHGLQAPVNLVLHTLVKALESKLA